MKMKQILSKSLSNRPEHGGAHELAFVGVVVVGIIGLLGFVGYNQWQQTSEKKADAASISLKAATYNILGQHHDPKYPNNPWSSRKARVAAKVSEYNPAIIGMQEVTYTNPLNQNISPQRGDVVRFMREKGYSSYTGNTYNNSPIFWKTSGFNVLARKEVQLVKQDATKRGPASRYLTYVRLNKGGKNISVFNYHFNHYRSIASQLDGLKKYYAAFKGSGDYVIWTGDFNGYEDDIRNRIACLYRIDKSSTVDHVLGSNPSVARINWTILSNTSPIASDHRLVGVYVSLR